MVAALANEGKGIVGKFKKLRYEEACQCGWIVLIAYSEI